MCDFCDYIFDYQLLVGNFRKESKKHMQKKEREIYTKKNSDNYLARNASNKISQ